MDRSEAPASKEEKKKEYGVTEPHFAYFKARVKYWAGFFGVTGWRIDVRQCKMETALAAFNCTFKHRTAAIYLNTVWNEEPIPWMLDRSAFHEVCEILLVDLSRLCHYNFNEETVDERSHEIIRALENSVFPKCRGA